MTEQQPLVENYDPPPDGACINYEVCGNVPPGANRMCVSCLDDARKSDRE